jgi:hypothetical protein
MRATGWQDRSIRQRAGMARAGCMCSLLAYGKSSPFVHLLLLIKLGSRGLVLSATGPFHANRWADVMG